MDRRYDYDKPGSLMRETLRLVRKEMETRGLLGIHEDTNIPFYWLRTFAANRFKNPSVNRVQFLYEHLSGKKLLKSKG